MGSLTYSLFVAKKWSDNWGEKFLYIMGVLIVLFVLFAFIHGAITDTLPPVSGDGGDGSYDGFP
jgi:hypothetical protein